MADMDIDGLFDKPTNAPAPAPATRPPRFAPKGSKLKPKTEPSDSSSLVSSTSNSTTQSSLPLPKKEEPDVKPPQCTTSDDAIVEMDIDNGGKQLQVFNNAEEDKQTDHHVNEHEDDVVVREIDVYLTPSVDPNTRLYVLQYPLRPMWRPYDLDERCKEVRVKPPSAEVEVDLSMDVDSKYYDSNRDPSLVLEKQTLTTTWKPPNTSRYAVGVLTGNKLHLNPIHAVVQLRPSWKHLDSKELKRKATASSNVVGTVKTEVPEEGKRSGASKNARIIPEQNKDCGEDWVPLKYHGTNTDLAAGYLQKMTTEDGSQIHFPMSSCDYLNSLCPGTSNDSFSSKGPSRRRILLTLPLKERFRNWLLEGPAVHRFDALKYLAPDESVEEVLGVLEEYGRLVQGLWVPKSPLVYGTDQGFEVLVRDFVLLLFSKSVTIKSSQLHPRRPQLAKAMKDVLNVLAVERPSFSDWKLKELPDFNFTKLYPSIVKKQEEEWESLEKKINDFFGGLSGPNIKASSKSNTINSSAATKSSSKVAVRTSNGATSEEVRNAITKALQKLFQTIKVCSFQKISERLKAMAVSDSYHLKGLTREAVASIDAYPDELHEILSQVAVNIHGLCVPKSSPDHPQYDALRKIVIDLFVAEGPNAKLQKATIYEAARMELKREILPNEYQKVLHELCISQHSAWILRSGDGNSEHE